MVGPQASSNPHDPLRTKVPLVLRASGPATENPTDEPADPFIPRALSLADVFRYAPEVSGDDYVLFDPIALRFLDCNRSAHERLQYSREEFLALDPAEIQANHNEGCVWLAKLAARMLQEGHGSFASLHRSKTGLIRNVTVRFLRVQVDQQPIILQAFLDQTEQGEISWKLAQMNRQLNEAEEISHIGSWELIHASGHLSWSDETFRIFEVDPNAPPNTYKNFLTLVHPDDRRAVDAAYQKALLSGNAYRIQHRLLFPDGREKHVLERGKTTYDNRGWPLTTIGTVQDVTTMHELERQLEDAAYRDSLTDLPNKAATLRHLEGLLQSKTYNESIALINLDLDQFDSVNETFGPEVGNRVLCSTALTLRDLLQPDDWVARLGSDEFLVIRHRGITSLGAAVELGHALQSKLASGRLVGQTLPVQPTACVGVSSCPEHGSDAHTLLQCANSALMEAKRRGRNQMQAYSTTVSQRLRARLEMETQLEHAVERGQLRLLYQPQVDGEGVIVGAEALVRWTNHQGVTIPPDTFIPLAEQTGQIHAIGAWVIEAAFAQILSWQNQGLIVPPIAVNVSAVQLEPRLPSLPDTVRSAMQRHGLAARQVELEITETALMAYPKEAAEQLNALTAMGFKLAIDDFGTGYSSLATLHSLHLSKLKIDRCFVDRLEQTITDRVILRATISMARELGLRTLAEGVETEQQWNLLQELGCDLFQGYLFDRPLPPEQFASKLKGTAG
ncbi:EAL domain-containing protein [Synechococcus sp. CBW1002]|uniref:putative bifunctional diguanylate cyclase/phosphodiesterase n=1 Tax=Synechococcus sp. CBW1002 TaxID=1353134 RepID=UPI0018CF2670|nr:GGDEF domain-containing phosphodiesterase [Synechococcus sp. CBW1002]QPN60613.1 EAL domain-containing protein [Synechococcus sp. CBW1002]